MSLKPQTDFSNFLALDIRLGRIIKAERSLAQKPTYRITADFGPEIGLKTSSAQITHHYQPEALVGRQVLGVVNFPPRQIGPFMSEVLTLGFADTAGHIVLAASDKPVAAGARLL